MHKEKVSRMSHKGFSLLGTQKEFIFLGIFLGCYFLKYCKC
jgi:hypothetical protein